jgi:hypothetical protein
MWQPPLRERLRHPASWMLWLMALRTARRFYGGEHHEAERRRLWEAAR